jgi:hypothetical protein
MVLAYQTLFAGERDMKLLKSKWMIMTIIAQSLILFCVYVLLFLTPHLWDTTYESLLGGRPLPAITQLLLNMVPGTGSGPFCPAFLFSLTPFCFGMMLIATAESELLASQRIMFVISATWGITLFLFVFFVVAEAMPFVQIKGCLCGSSDVDSVKESQRWTVGTLLYAALLIATTVWICIKKNKN